jgi:hypothetical protein
MVGFKNKILKTLYQGSDDDDDDDGDYDEYANYNSNNNNLFFFINVLNPEPNGP